MNKFSPTLTPLLVDENHKIWLLNKSTRTEIKMRPLCKALYFLFLQYPAGITLYDLPKYERELLTIYKNVSRRHDFGAMKSSINNLVNRRENSFHEKSARIKSIFKNVVPNKILDFYYIKGERGFEKQISLPRNLVNFESKAMVFSD